MQLRIPKKALTLWRLRLLAAALLVAAVSGVLFAFFGVYSLVLPVAALPAGLWCNAYYLPRMWRSHKYRLENRQITVRRGVYQKTVHTALCDAVLLRETRRAPLQLLLGLSTVVLHVAGGRLILNELDKETADRLVEGWDELWKE